MIPKVSVRLLLFCLLSVVGFAMAEVLANSGNPMRAVNPQRNNQVNKKFLCPEVAPERTQVWNIDWQINPADVGFSYYDSGVLTQDDQGFIYLQGYVNNQPSYLKVSGTDGSHNADSIFTFSAFSEATHVQGNKMYLIAGSRVAVVNTTNMQEIVNLDLGQTLATGSFAPFGNDLMVSSLTSGDISNLFTYLNTSAYQFETNQPNGNGANPSDVIVYKNSSNVEIPITVYGTFGNPVTVWSPNYQFTIENSYFRTAAYVQDNQLVIHCATPAYTFFVLFYNADTGVLLRNVSLATWQGSPVVSLNFPHVFGSNSIAVISVASGMFLVDFLNNKSLANNVNIQSAPLHSIPDNTVLISASDASNSGPSKPQQLISFDWDTQMINAVGSFPADGLYSDIVLSPPLVGDDCTVYAFYDDYTNYPGVLLSFKPLPISNIVPIAECINADGVGYFSYNNLEDKRITIPFVSDRNNLEPMGIAPTTDFRANQRGKYFPLSSRVTLDNTTSSFTWKLEDYVLSFSTTQQLRCPQNVTIVLYFNSTTAPDSNFSEWTRQNFATFTAIAGSRVTVVAGNKRSALATNFQVKLQIAADGSNQELTPEQAAQLFANEQIVTFNTQLAQDATYSTAGITLLDVDGVPLDTEISGTIPPKATPVVSPPNSQVVPTTTNTPKGSTTTSTGARTTAVSLIVLVAVLSFVV